MYEASALKRVPWPENRAPETEFHLNFLRQFPVLMREEALYKVNDDATVRLSVTPALASLRGETEFQRLQSLERIIELHGDALRIHGPALWGHMVANLVSLEAIFGRKRQMRQFYFYGIRRGAEKLYLTLIYAAGLIGPTFLVRLRFLYKILRDSIAARKS